MKKLNLFIVFAIAIIAGCATLSVLSCSEDEFEGFEDDEVYTLSNRKKTRSGEIADAVGTASFGDIMNGELLWHKRENTTLVFTVGTGGQGSTCQFPVEFNADVVYTLGSDSITKLYGAILEWRPGYADLSIEITSVTSNTINYQATYTGDNYNPAISSPTNADHIQSGFISK